jgi:hypothetical protein
MTIYTQGQPVPGVPFQGEVMRCAVCSKEERSDPAHSSGWSLMEWQEPGGSWNGCYLCPQHSNAENVKLVMLRKDREQCGDCRHYKLVDGSKWAGKCQEPRLPHDSYNWLWCPWWKAKPTK